MPERRIKETEEKFMETMFSDILEVHDHLRIVTWVKLRNGKSESQAHATTRAAGEYCHKQRIQGDVYFGLGLHDSSIGEGRRGTEKEVRGIAGFAIDIDCTGNGHKKSNLFETKDEANEFITSIEVPPSLIVDSGGGYHLYWLFHEPWIFTGEEEWERARRMSRGWHSYLKGKSGRTLDPTFTLDRIWRVAGTLNLKERITRNVTIALNQDFMRYEPEDTFGDHAMVEALLPDVSTMEVDDVEISISAPIPERCLLMVALDRSFAAEWHGFRKRESQSESDMAIAHAGSAAGWSADEICQSVLKNRMMHGAEPKIHHRQYWRLLIQKSMGRNVRMPAGEDDDEESDPARMAMMLLAQLSGLPISKTFTIGSRENETNAKFYLEFENGTDFEIGDIRFMMSVSHWTRIKQLIDPDPTWRKPPKQQFMAAVTASVKYAEDRTERVEQPAQKASAWVENYIGQTNVADNTARTWEDSSRVVDKGRPFVKNGMLYISKAGIKEWLNANRNERSVQNIQVDLMMLGFNQVDVPLIMDGRKKSSRSYWRKDE